MILRTTWILVISSLVLGMLAACGGGGGNAMPPPPMAVEDFSPGGAIPSEGDHPFLITGWGFGETGEACTLRFTATSGTPFAMGTSATLMAHGTIEHTGWIRGAIEEANILPTTGGVTATIEMLLPDGSTHTIDGHMATFADLLYALVVTEVDPAQGVGGDTVTVRGSGFSQYSPGLPSVFFGEEEATNVHVLSDTELTCVVPSGLGIVHVSATNNYDSGMAYNAFSYAVDWAWDPDFGTPISSSTDDGSWEAVFTGGFTFPFYGTTYSSLWAASNGSVTFGGPWYYYAPNAFAPEPQIALLQTDQTTYTGQIHFKQLPDRVVITYPDIEHLYSGHPGLSTYQLQLRPDGSFAILWQEVGADTWIDQGAWGGNVLGWTGISPGTDAGFTEVTTDWSAGPSACAPGEALTEHWQYVGNLFDLDFHGVAFTPDGAGGYVAVPFIAP